MFVYKKVYLRIFKSETDVIDNLPDDPNGLLTEISIISQGKILIMIDFLRFVVVLLVIWYGIRLIVKYVMPWLIMRFINKQQRNFDNYSQSGNRQKEGEINIKKGTGEKKKKDDPEFGEYVDFEEIEPDQEQKDE